MREIKSENYFSKYVREEFVSTSSIGIYPRFDLIVEKDRNL